MQTLPSTLPSTSTLPSSKPIIITRFYMYWQFWISCIAILIFSCIAVGLCFILFEINNKGIISNASLLIDNANATIASTNILIANSEATITSTNETLAQANTLMDSMQSTLNQINTIMGITNFSSDRTTRSPLVNNNSNTNSGSPASIASSSPRGLRYVTSAP